MEFDIDIRAVHLASKVCNIIMFVSEINVKILECISQLPHQYLYLYLSKQNIIDTASYTEKDNDEHEEAYEN